MVNQIVSLIDHLTVLCSPLLSCTGKKSFGYHNPTTCTSKTPASKVNKLARLQFEGLELNLLLDHSIHMNAQQRQGCSTQNTSPELNKATAFVPSICTLLQTCLFPHMSYCKERTLTNHKHSHFLSSQKKKRKKNLVEPGSQ